MKYILTDVDNVLLDFSHQFEEWVIKKDIPIIKGQLQKTYTFESMFHTDQDYRKLIDEFYNCEYTMSTFKEYRECSKPINDLKNMGYTFVAITACDDKDHMTKSRAENIANLMGFSFEDVHVVGFNSSKEFALSQYGPSIWVEDTIEHAIKGAELGHRTFLIDHEYNKNKNGPFTRVNNWYDIKEILCDTER